MVTIDTLYENGVISKITDLELERYLSFFENAYKDNFEHSKANISGFPRWSIISGYYAMHDIAKLFFVKKFRIKVEQKMHTTTIFLLSELTKNEELSKLIEKGYEEFLTLATDLEQAKNERMKAQYYTGTAFLKEEYAKKAQEFRTNILQPFIAKMEVLIK